MEWFKSKWKRPNWSRTFYDYLFSYIIIVCLALAIVATVVFARLIPEIEQEVKTANLSLLAQVREAMDMRTQEMNRIANRISINPDLTPFMLGSSGYGLLKTQRLMEEYRSSNSFIYDLAVYYTFRADPNVYAASGTYTIDRFFDYMYSYENWGKSGLQQMLGDTRMPVMRPLENVRLYGRETKPFATYIYPLPINASKPYGTVIFLIDGQSFASLFRNVLHADVGHAFIFNNKSELVAYASASSEKEAPQSVLEQLKIMSIPEGMHTVDTDSGKWSVVKLKSEVNGWIYLSAVPSDRIMKQAYNRRTLFLKTLACLLVAGTLASFFLTLRNYRPLRGLADIIRSQNLIREFSSKRDEISIIGHAVGEVSKENRGLHSIIKNQAGVLKENVLLTLLKGKVWRKAELAHAQKLANIPLDEPQFAVLLCLIDDYPRFVKTNTQSMQQILKYSLMNILEELSSKQGCGYGLEWTEDRGVVLILNMREGVGRDELLDLAVQASQYFKQYFHFTLTVGIGRIYSDSFMIHRSYLEAANAAKYRFLKGHGHILFYDHTAPRQEGEFWYPTELQSRLVIAIKQGDGDEVQRVVQEMTERIAERAMTMETVEFICFDIINTVMKTMIEMGIELKDYIDESMENLFSPKYETMEELEELVVNFCSRVCSYIEGQKESKNVNLYQNVLAYVNDCYTDPSVSLENIAEKFGVSPSYLSRYFKDQTGNPLMRYMDGMRMNKAKELLKNSDMKLKDIIEHVGYVDQTNFIRKFKRNEGITPMQYRNVGKEG